MKTAELVGAELDYWVAKAEGLVTRGPGWVIREPGRGVVPFEPSSNWADGGPLIEREKIEIHSRSDRHIAEWGALPCSENGDAWEKMQRGETPLIAAMRVFVATKFGAEVSD